MRDLDRDRARYGELRKLAFDEFGDGEHGELVVRASIGSAIAPLDGVLPQDLMDAADADMYRDKRERRRMRMHDAGDVVPAPRPRESNTAPLVREVLNGAPVTRGIPYIGEIIPPLADHQAPQRHHA